MRNPVAHKPSYRQYVIFKLPQLRVLDFKRITLKVFSLVLFALAFKRSGLNRSARNLWQCLEGRREKSR